MPSLNEFLGKPKDSGRNWEGWETLIGLYGCQKCDKDTNIAYYNSERHLMMWACPDDHESKVQL